ncbi:MAG: YecH family protein [Candidatus Schmidhempelia sp.]|nr:YecH family protein [Candidatus Schmidhempelia sp.]
MTSIHGHEVIAMMRGNHYQNEEELLEQIGQRFGLNAKFHTCSQSDLSAYELITFLRDRGKIVTTKDNKLIINSQRICSH